MKQGTCRTPITWPKEDTAHSSWIKELHKTMSAAKGPTKWRDWRVERWHDKRMRKEGCNLGNKKFMNNSYCEASQTRKTSSK